MSQKLEDKLNNVQRAKFTTDIVDYFKNLNIDVALVSMCDIHIPDTENHEYIFNYENNPNPEEFERVTGLSLAINIGSNIIYQLKSSILKFNRCEFDDVESIIPIIDHESECGCEIFCNYGLATISAFVSKLSIDHKVHMTSDVSEQHIFGVPNNVIERIELCINTTDNSIYVKGIQSDDVSIKRLKIAHV